MFWLAFVAYAVFLIVMGWALRRVIVSESMRESPETVAA